MCVCVCVDRVCIYGSLYYMLYLFSDGKHTTAMHEQTWYNDYCLDSLQDSARDCVCECVCTWEGGEMGEYYHKLKYRYLSQAKVHYAIHLLLC